MGRIINVWKLQLKMNTQFSIWLNRKSFTTEQTFHLNILEKLKNEK